MANDIQSPNLKGLTELDRSDLEHLLHFISGAVDSGLERGDITAITIANRINKVLSILESEQK